MDFSRATAEHVDAAQEIVTQCQEELTARGILQLVFKPVGHQRYFCYDKLLTPSAS